ncbi:MAG: GvpL/GvpF family gas vesicle protein [Hamadaea sp.]|nr:GvpL/GvpF family gas vesicle protein [Hamadaea sp.]NUT04872.1 GvpL/GvpF family gas vesicle protein [Hamadaea sp.]
MSDRDTGQGRVCYVYGVVPADVEIDEEVRGVAAPPARVQVIRRGRVAGLVSEIDRDRPLGRPDDLVAHKQVLDMVAAVAPVLPMRFGAVAPSAEVIADELLDAHQDELAADLDDIEGYAEYVLHGRYDSEALLAAVLQENPAAARLRDALHGVPEEQSRDARIRLGEFIGQAVEAKRKADTETVMRELQPLAREMSVRDPTHEDDAIYLAVLAETGRSGDLEQYAEDLAHRWDGWITPQLLGPMAAYDFVAAPEA